MLGAMDWVVIATYFIIIAAIGVWAGRKGKTTEDYFLGGRRMPWYVAMLSLVATETSAVTFIGVPGDAFGGNMWYVQMAFGSFAARIIVATLFLTAFYKFRVTTVYEFLKHRFGEATRGTGAAFYIVTRVLGSGVRLCVMAEVLAVVVPSLSFPVSLTLVVVGAMAYTLFGGIRAIMWTDVVQFGIYMGGAWLAFGLLLSQIDGGWAGMLAVARHATTATGDPIDKTRIFDFSFSFTKDSVFWAVVLCGLFQSMAAFGTDQDMTQRMLTCRKPALAKRGMILTGVLDFASVFTFLLIGLALYAFSRQTGFASQVGNTNEIFPRFIVQCLPLGVRGLLLAAVFAAAMSSVDSAPGALSTSAVVDIYRVYIRRKASDRHYLFVARVLVAFFTLALAGVAWMCHGLGGVLVLAFKIVSYTYGGLLGVFLLGLLTKRGRNVTNIIAMISSVGVVILLRNVTPVAWHWMIIIGTVWTFGFAVIFPGKPKANEQAAG